MSFITSFKDKVLGNKKASKIVNLDVSDPEEKSRKNKELFNIHEARTIKKYVDLDAEFKKRFPRDINSFIPAGEQGVAMDSAIVPKYQWANNIPPEMMNVLSQYFIGYQACALLQQNWIIDRACSVPAEDCVSAGYEVSLHDNNDLPNSYEKSEKILMDIKRDSEIIYKMNEICQRAILKMKVFGYSIVIPVFDEDDVDMSEPFNIDGLSNARYLGMKVIEPYWLMPSFDSESVSNPASESFYVPTWYTVGGNKKIHKSWVIRLVNSEVSDILKPTYYYGGLPLTQQIYERAYSAERIANEIPLIVTTKRLRVMGVNMEMVTANPEHYKDMMENITYFLDNFSVAMVDAKTSITQLDTSVGDIDSVLTTSYELIASVAKMPVTKLLKTQPHGMNSAGNYELEDYKNELKTLQNNHLVPILRRHFELYLKCVLKKDIKLNIVFNPYESPSEREQAETNAVKSNMYATLLGSGVISPEEVRTLLVNDDKSGFTTLEIKDDLDLDSEFGEFIKPHDKIEVEKKIKEK